MTTPDTQPIHPVSDDTQRLRSVRRRRVPLIVLTGVIAALVMIGAVVGGAVFLLMQPATPLTLIVDGQPYTGTTHAATVADLLAEQGIALGEHDRIIPPSSAPVQSGMTVRIDHARPVVITVDDEARTVWTPATAPADILSAAGIRLAAEDALSIDGSPVAPDRLAAWTAPVDWITVRRAVPLTIHADSIVLTLTTTAASVGTALFEAGVTLYAADTVYQDAAPVRLNTALIPGAVVRVDRAAPIVVEVDGALIETRTSAATVGDALASSGIALVGLDYTVPGESAAIVPGMTISVFRVKEAVIAEDALIDYQRVVQPDPSREIDQIAVVQVGQPGTQRTMTRIRYENGVEVEREVESSYLLVPPRDEVVSYGTNVIIRTLNTPDGPIEYWRTFRVYATSYHPAALGGDNVTATGRILQRGIVGADPDLLPYGTNVYVEGYGTGVIADTGLPRESTRWIDLGYSDEDWINWYRWVTIYLLTPAPDEIDYFPPP